MSLLKAVRVAAKIPRTRVASDLDVDYNHLYRIERGLAGASRDLADRLSKYFEGAITREQILYPDEFAEVTKRRKKPVRSVTMEAV